VITAGLLETTMADPPETTTVGALGMTTAGAPEMITPDPRGENADDLLRTSLPSASTYSLPQPLTVALVLLARQSRSPTTILLSIS
jgi:hypothetical protein